MMLSKLLPDPEAKIAILVTFIPPVVELAHRL